MKAFVFEEYGSPDVLQLKEIPTPVPRDDEVLVRVHAVSINDWDLGNLDGSSFVNRLLFGLRKPKKQILGSDIAGRVEAVGRNVQRFRPGEEVFGDLSGEWGGFAEYVCAKESQLALKSSEMTFEQAAAIPQAAMLAVQALRDVAQLRSGQKLLINGAGGGVGTFGIQLARLYGAEVTAVDTAAKSDVMRSLGATDVIDYTREDFTRSGKRYDVILDVKTSRSMFDLSRALVRGGTYVTVGGSMARLFQTLLWMPWLRFVARKRFRLVVLKTNKDLEYMKELFEARKVLPVIDGPYPFAELPAAFRLFADGRHVGKVVIRVRAFTTEDTEDTEKHRGGSL